MGRWNRLLCSMSESATTVNLFFLSSLAETAVSDTLPATGAEDRALLGSNPSADSGAKTKLGFGETLSPSGEAYATGIGIKAINPRGLGTESSEIVYSFY